MTGVQDLRRPAAAAVDPDERLHVVFVAGWGRSGSTLAGATLDAVDGVACVGESAYLWDTGVLANWPCGCGRPFDGCALWPDVLDAVRGPQSRVELAHDMRWVLDHASRTRHLAALELGARRGWRADDIAWFSTTMGAVYAEVARRRDARVVVDTSKRPSYGKLLEHLDVDFSVVHLVRDPRAVAFSWAKHVPRFVAADGSRSEVARHSAARSSVFWDAWNAAAERLWRPLGERYVQLRYEDFVADPRTALRRILAAAGVAARTPLPVRGARTIELGENHMVFGNPVRFRGGAVTLREDDAWRRHLPVSDRRTVERLTAPFRGRYGY